MSPRYRLTIGWLTLFVVGTDLFIVSPLLPLIARDFSLSAASAGLCATVFAVTYMFSAPALGVVADRFGRRRTLTVCAAGFAVANFLIVTADSFALLLALRILAGITASGVTPLIYAGVGEAAAPERRATWMAFAVSGLLLSLSLGAPIGSLIGAAWGWRAPFVVLAGLSLLLVLGNRLVWPPDEGGRSQVGTEQNRLALGTMSRRLAPTVLWATALYGVYTYLGVGLTEAGLSPTQIAQAIAFYGFAALAGTLLGGRAADRIGVRETMIASLIGLAVCLAVLGPALRSELATDIVLILASITAQLFFPAQQSGLVRDFPTRRATVLALNNSALFLGISLGSLIGGEAVERSGFAADAAIGAGIACAALAVVAAWQQPRRALEPTIA
jgi:predicted MFS family arabinose efflux permease